MDTEEPLDNMPRLIQAGMGIHISNARLANATARLGALGVVSSVALRHIVVEEVRSGDPQAIALAHRFPIRRYSEELLSYAPGGDRYHSPVPPASRTRFIVFSSHIHVIVSVRITSTSQMRIKRR